MRDIVSQKKVILFVATKPPTNDLVREFCEKFNIPYITERWLGGTFTNFSVIKKRVEYFCDLKKKYKEGGFEKYTKKEKAKIELRLKDLSKKFEGMVNLRTLPDAVFIFDMKKDVLAAKEARMKGIKIVGITDTNVNPMLADYPIPANDDSIPGIKYILEKIKNIFEGREKT